MRYSPAAVEPPDRPGCHPWRVSAGSDTSTGPGITRGRLEGISDGIMAVAITLLVLGVEPPTPEAGQSLWEAIDRDALGSIGLFVLSFAIIARFWLVHHDAMRTLPAIVPARVVVINFGFLLGICLVPFATAVYARNADDFTALAIYAGTFAAISALSSAMFALGGSRGRLVQLYAPVVFLAALPLALVVSPRYAPLAWLVMIVLPHSRLERRRRDA